VTFEAVTGETQLQLGDFKARLTPEISPENPSLDTHVSYVDFLVWTRVSDPASPPLQKKKPRWSLATGGAFLL
jgi:hypothetical protein